MRKRDKHRMDSRAKREAVHAQLRREVKSDREEKLKQQDFQMHPKTKPHWWLDGDT